ncbi:hypothetical protein FHG87_001042 [Trinorchestia longiramus]|nr:hypothetical protein FHG87_001042 [Trinorchestia longiramus]
MLATVVQPMRVHSVDTNKSWRGGGSKQKAPRGGGALASSGRKFLLLLWKNWLLQRRNVLQTIAELVLPVVFCVVLVVIRGLAPSDVYPEPTTFPTFSLNKLPSDLTPPTSDGLIEGVMKTFLGANARPRRSLDSGDGRTARLSRVKRQSFLDNVWGFLGADDLYWPVAYTPNTTEHAAVMKIVSDRLYPHIEGGDLELL